MFLSVIAPFGFADLESASILSAWVELAGVQIAQVLRNADNAPTAAEMVGVSARAGLTLDSLHGLFGPTLDPSSPDESVRRASVQVYEGEGRLVRQLGGRAVVVHPSPQSSDGPPEPELRRRQLLRSIDELSEIAKALDVEFLLENQPPGCPLGKSIAELADLIRASGATHMACCFDTGHAHLWGDATAGIRQAGSLLACVHASDNDGKTDQHHLCFDGTVDWRAVGAALAEIKYAGSLVMEVFLPADELHRRITKDWLARLHEELPLEG